jgi:hypothetical protein
MHDGNRGERVSHSTAECVPGGTDFSVDDGMQQRWRHFEYTAAESSSATSRAGGHANGSVYVDRHADGYGGRFEEDAAADADFFNADCEVRECGQD